MLLNHDEIVELIERGVVENAPLELVNQTSMDVTLGPTILWEAHLCETLRLGAACGAAFLADCFDAHLNAMLLLRPGEFILAQTEQVFNLPDDISMEYKLKSSMARIGLEHLNAGWCDPGWHGSVLTLELKNMLQFHSIQLAHGDRIGQVIFFRHRAVGEKQSYRARGRYNNDRVVKGAK